MPHPHTQTPHTHTPSAERCAAVLRPPLFFLRPRLWLLRGKPKGPPPALTILAVLLPRRLAAEAGVKRATLLTSMDSYLAYPANAAVSPMWAPLPTTAPSSLAPPRRSRSR